MLRDRYYSIKTDMNIVDIILGVDGRLRREMLLIPNSGNRIGDGIFEVETKQKEEIKIDNRREFEKYARHITEIKSVTFNAAFRKVYFFGGVKNIWFEAKRDVIMDIVRDGKKSPQEPIYWKLKIKAGTVGNPAFIDQAFEVIDDALGVKKPSRPINDKLKGKVKLEKPDFWPL